MSGTVRRRSRRSWQIQLELGSDPVTGARLRRFFSIKGTKKDAERALREAEHLRDTGFVLSAERLTFGEFQERWLADYAEPNVAPSTLHRYRQLLSRAGEMIGGVRLHDLTPVALQSLYGRLREDGLSNRTFVHHHRVIRECLQHAVDWQLIPSNPSDRAKPPRPVAP